MRTAEITDFIKLTIVMVLGVVIGLGIQYVTAQYSAPPASPPSGNIANPPLTTGASQTKSGGLTVGGVLQTNTQLNLCSGATCGFLRTNAHSHLRGSTVYLDSGSWGVILRDGAGSMNVQPRSDVSSMYVNDIYLRSAGRWLSDVANASGGTSFSQHQWVVVGGTSQQIAACPSGWKLIGCYNEGLMQELDLANNRCIKQCGSSRGCGVAASCIR
jgi:hypothetical protein